MSIIDDKEFYQARKCLEAWSKRHKEERGKENKSNAADVLTDDEVNINQVDTFSGTVFPGWI